MKQAPRHQEALSKVERESHEAQRLAERPHRIRRADIAATDSAEIYTAELSEKDSKGN